MIMMYMGAEGIISVTVPLPGPVLSVKCVEEMTRIPICLFPAKGSRTFLPPQGTAKWLSSHDMKICMDSVSLKGKTQKARFLVHFSAARECAAAGSTRGSNG
jgi:hypothetical protein